MSEAFSRFLANMMAIIVCFIAPSFLVLMQMRSTIQDKMQNAVVEFVDNARVEGEIRPEEYSELANTIYKHTGYDLEIRYYSKKAFPKFKMDDSKENFVDKNGNITLDANSMVSEGYLYDYELYTLDEITDAMYYRVENGTKVNISEPYKMKEGDYLAVTITRDTGNQMNALKSFFGLYDAKQEIVNYGAEVENNPNC